MCKPLRWPQGLFVRDVSRTSKIEEVSFLFDLKFSIHPFRVNALELVGNWSIWKTKTEEIVSSTYEKDS